VTDIACRAFRQTDTARRYERALSVEDAAAVAKILFPDGRGFALVQTPRTAGFLALANGVFQGPPVSSSGPPAPKLEDAFGARFFSGRGEIAWRRTPEGGRALLTLDEGAAPADGWTEAKAKPTWRRCATRLIWGLLEPKEVPAEDQWRELSSPRVGPIYVPPFRDDTPDDALYKDKGDRRRVALEVVEYARDATDGNVVAAGERLKGFAWLRKRTEEQAR
jgi:hypothetical protein